MSDENNLNPVELATELTIAWLGNQNNRVAAEDVPAFLRTMHATVTELASGSTAASGSAEEAPAEEFMPAVTARKSLASKDHIISMIDGKRYRTLRRHLSTHGLTPEEYRSRYKLKADYPMVAENYSAQRREMAKKIGLGRKPRAAAEATSAAPARRGRAKKTD
jgi:predicted transcriptional regulator